MSPIYFSNEVPPVNPFANNGLYDDSWVRLTITESADYHMFTSTTRLFEFKLSKRCMGWQLRAMDYIAYQKLYHRNVIITAAQGDYAEAERAFQGHSLWDKFLRSYEPEVLVHSTTPGAFPKILKDGALKSWNKVKAANDVFEETPIGAKLGDPGDFRDFVMLGTGVEPEIVVNSREKGGICTDTECEYTPGARFYFDTRQMIAEGLLTRDGCHYKVKDELPIKFALFIASGQIMDGQRHKVTPASFARASDEAFRSFLRHC